MSDLMRFIYPPMRSDYANVESMPSYERIQLRGGAGRYRSSIQNSSQLVDCVWKVRCDGFDYIRAFVRMFNRDPSPFLIDLKIGRVTLEECEAWFMPDTFTWEDHDPVYICRARLEVIPPEYCPDEDANIVCIGNLFGPEWRQLADDLDHLVNTVRPGIFPYGAHDFLQENQ